MSKSLIFLTNGIFPYSIGGIQRHSRLLIESLAKSDQNLIIHVIHPHEELVFESMENIIEHRIDDIDTRSIYIYEIYRYSKRAFSVINSLPSSIPIYVQGLSLIYGINKLKNKIYFNPHGLEAFQTLTIKDYLYLFPFRILTTYIANRSCKVISLGGKLTKILEKRINNSSAIVTIPNAVSISKKTLSFHKNDFNSPIKCLFVSRFAFNKGIDVLIDAIFGINSEGYGNNFHFILGGTGPLLEYYSKNKTASNINYLGFVSDEDLKALYQEADVFVFPTLFEGMPTVVLEAMSFGLPIIVSDVGATAELVNKENGYLIEPGSRDSLKDALLAFSNLTVLEKSKLSENSYSKVFKNYTWEKIAQKTFDTIFTT